MKKLKKILIIIVITIASIYLLAIFILFNFPFDSLVSRMDHYLQKEYDTSLEVENIKYRLPLKLYLEGVKLVRGKEFFFITLDTLSIRLRLFNFLKYKTIEIIGNGMGVRSEFFEASNAFINLLSEMNISQLLRRRWENSIKSVHFMVRGVDIERVFISGFEFASLKLKQIQISLKEENGEFRVERGMLNADIATSEITGKLGFESMDLMVTVRLTDGFYNRYNDLRGIVDSVFENGTMKISIKGKTEKPQVKIIKK